MAKSLSKTYEFTLNCIIKQLTNVSRLNIGLNPDLHNNESKNISIAYSVCILLQHKQAQGMFSIPGKKR